MKDGSVDAEDVLTTQSVDGGLTQFSYHFTKERWLVSFPAIWNLVFLYLFILVSSEITLLFKHYRMNNPSCIHDSNKLDPYAIPMQLFLSQ